MSGSPVTGKATNSEGRWKRMEENTKEMKNGMNKGRKWKDRWVREERGGYGYWGAGVKSDRMIYLFLELHVAPLN